MVSYPLLWLEDSSLYALSGMALPVFLFSLAGSVVLALWVMVSKVRASVLPAASPSFMANLYGFWLVAMVLWGGYFFSFRIPGMFDITVDRIAFFLVAVVAFVMIVRRQALSCHDHLIETLYVVFLLLCVVSMAIHGFSSEFAGGSKPWYQFLSGYLLPFFSFVIVKRFLQPERDFPRVFGILFALGVYLCLVAFLEEFRIDEYIFPRYVANPDIPLHLDRARGPFLNAAFNGLFLCIALLAGVTLLPFRHRFSRLFHVMLMALFPVAIYFTHTRSVLLQFVLIVAGLIFCYRLRLAKWKVVLIPLTIMVLALVAQSDRLASSDRGAGGLNQAAEVEIRFQLISKSVGMVAEHPLFGRGFGQFRAAAYFVPEEVDFQHNHLIGLAAETGLVGLALYLAILVISLVHLVRLITAMPEEAFINGNFLLILGLGVLCVIINNTFVEPSLHIFAQTALFMFIGMIDNLYGRWASAGKTAALAQRIRIRSEKKPCQQKSGIS